MAAPHHAGGCYTLMVAEMSFILTLTLITVKDFERLEKCFINAMINSFTNTFTHSLPNKRHTDNLLEGCI
uniref:Uncharacterized protein n=1 Tax=Anguilla anguilla TaxID=7936 RepID=A0A0E9S169_ANGAN